ncbi:MAG: transposase, partial [Desulfamplus sp.]|nr:transposase [Desulfamplus sp.]
GKRTVVVTYNPPSARKQAYTLDSKLETLRAELLEMRAKVRNRAPQWRNPEVVRERYVRACERLHLPTCLYDISFEAEDGKGLSFAKNSYQVERRTQQMGKNIIVTDNTDWTTQEIVEASIDRWQVEDCFRQSKDDDLVGVMPLRRWTDGKIECHFFTCMVAMALLRRLEIRLSEAGIKRTAADVMGDMRNLHSIVSVNAGRRTVQRRLEPPSKTQAAVLSALGATVDQKGVLQVK